MGENTAFGFLPQGCLNGMNEVGLIDCRAASSFILVDEWGCRLASLELDGKEQCCAQADASGLTCETGCGVPLLKG